MALRRPSREGVNKDASPLFEIPQKKFAKGRRQTSSDNQVVRLALDMAEPSPQLLCGVCLSAERGAAASSGADRANRNSPYAKFEASRYVLQNSRPFFGPPARPCVQRSRGRVVSHSGDVSFLRFAAFCPGITRIHAWPT